MRARRLQALAVIPLAAGVLASCGGGADEKPESAATPGKTVSGETETGMKMKVETFFDPADDPQLKQLDAYRAAGKYPPVDYHRVTADNSAGQVADSGRDVTFAKTPEAISSGQGVKARFSCDALAYEWLPQSEDAKSTYAELRKAICADGPPKQDGIAPGAKKVYFLISDRSFAERGLRTFRVFGPRDAEFK